MRQLCLVSDPYHIQSKPFPCKNYTFFSEPYHSICSHLIQSKSSLIGDFVWHRGSTLFLDVQDVPSGEQFTNPDTYVNWIDETEPSGDDCVLLDCNDGELVKIRS